jgi:hypothetical protein
MAFQNEMAAGHAEKKTLAQLPKMASEPCPKGQVSQAWVRRIEREIHRNAGISVTNSFCLRYDVSS